MNAPANEESQLYAMAQQANGTKWFPNPVEGIAGEFTQNLESDEVLSDVKMI